MSNSEKLSVNKIKRLLTLFKFIASQKSGNKSTVLSLLNEKSINEISESIYNLLYNKNLNLNLSKSQKAKLRKITKPNARSFEDISKKSFSIKRRHNKNYSTRKWNWNNSFNFNTCPYIVAIKIVKNGKVFSKR